MLRSGCNCLRIVIKSLLIRRKILTIMARVVKVRVKMSVKVADEKMRARDPELRVRSSKVADMFKEKVKREGEREREREREREK